MTDRFQSYRDRIAASTAHGIGSPPAPVYHGPSKPRDNWPVDKRDLIDRHRECATMAIGWAAQNMRDAEAVAAFREDAQ